MQFNLLGILFCAVGAIAGVRFGVHPIVCVAIGGAATLVLDLVYRFTLGDFEDEGGAMLVGDGRFPVWAIAIGPAVVPAIVLLIDRVGSSAPKEPSVAEFHALLAEIEKESAATNGVCPRTGDYIQSLIKTHGPTVDAVYNEELKLEPADDARIKKSIEGLASQKCPVRFEFLVKKVSPYHHDYRWTKPE